MNIYITKLVVHLSDRELGKWNSKAVSCLLLLLEGGVGITQDADVAVADVSARLRRRRLRKAAQEIEESHIWFSWVEKRRGEERVCENWTSLALKTCRSDKPYHPLAFFFLRPNLYTHKIVKNGKLYTALNYSNNLHVKDAGKFKICGQLKRLRNGARIHGPHIISSFCFTSFQCLIKRTRVMSLALAG